MYSIKKQQQKFYKNVFRVLLFPDLSKVSYFQSYSYFSGVINIFWQSWNYFWRTFWLAHIKGGEFFNSSRIIGSNSNLDENEAIHYLLHLMGKRRRRTGRITGSYAEPTWGDANLIQTLSTNYNHPSRNFTNVQNAFTVFGTTVKELQIVRNACIHSDKDTLNKIKTDIFPYYIIQRNCNPKEIIFAEEIGNGKKAINKWKDELIAFIEFIK